MNRLSTYRFRRQLFNNYMYQGENRIQRTRHVSIEMDTARWTVPRDSFRANTHTCIAVGIHLSKFTGPRRWFWRVAYGIMFSSQWTRTNTLSLQSTTPGNNGAHRNAEFRCPGKYRVILTVIAGGLSAPQLKYPYPATATECRVTHDGGRGLGWKFWILCHYASRERFCACVLLLSPRQVLSTITPRASIETIRAQLGRYLPREENCRAWLGGAFQSRATNKSHLAEILELAPWNPSFVITSFRAIRDAGSTSRPYGRRQLFLFCTLSPLDWLSRLYSSCQPRQDVREKPS